MTIKHPYKNESESCQIDALTIENRLDQISLYGKIDLTKDKRGLADAIALANIVNRAVTELQSFDLPDVITVEQTVKVPNPFD